MQSKLHRSSIHLVFHAGYHQLSEFFYASAAACHETNVSTMLPEILKCQGNQSRYAKNAPKNTKRKMSTKVNAKSCPVICC